MNYRETSEIFQKTWEIVSFDQNVNYSPPSEDWNCNDPPDIDDIEVWEQIYYQSGSFGIYAAWHPKYEFYIIVHDLFKGDLSTIEKFWGEDAGYRVYKKSQKLGVDLEVSKLFVETINQNSIEF